MPVLARAHAELEVATDGARDPAPQAEEQRRALAHGSDPAHAGGDTVESDQRAQPDRASGGAGIRGTIGRVLTEHVPGGWYGRLELEAFAAGAHRSAGPVGGALIGGEGWSAEGSGGGGLPMSFFLGIRSPALFFSLGIGVNLFIVDEVEDDAGFGVYAPFGSGALGIELGGFRLLADARAIYRWQWGATDRAQLQLGLTVAQFIEQPVRARVRRRNARGR